MTVYAVSDADAAKENSGLTLVELIVAFTIMLILTTMAVPLARARVRRDRERESASCAGGDARGHRQI